MSSPPDPSTELFGALRHYTDIAHTDNLRQMRDFIAGARQNWHPSPDDNDGQPYGEGYTEEGHFTLCVWQLAFKGVPGAKPERNYGRPLCEAEEWNEVLLSPTVEEFEDVVEKPICDPRPKGEIQANLEELRAGLREQLKASNDPAIASIDIELPSDFAQLMSMTDGVKGTGIPTDMDYRTLVWPLRHHSADPDAVESIGGVWMSGLTPLASWKIGHCHQTRRISYVYCHWKDKDVSSACWRVVDWGDPSFGGVHKSLADFLMDEAKGIQEHPEGEHELLHIYNPLPLSMQ